VKTALYLVLKWESLLVRLYITTRRNTASDIELICFLTTPRFKTASVMLARIVRIIGPSINCCCFFVRFMLLIISTMYLFCSSAPKRNHVSNVSSLPCVSLSCLYIPENSTISSLMLNTSASAPYNALVRSTLYSSCNSAPLGSLCKPTDKSISTASLPGSAYL